MDELVSVGNLGAGGLVGVIAIKAWDWFLNRRVDGAERAAEATLIDGLTKRIVAIEARLASVEAQLASERDDHEQTRVALNRERDHHNRTKAELMRLGGTVPQ